MLDPLLFLNSQKTYYILIFSNLIILFINIVLPLAIEQNWAILLTNSFTRCLIKNDIITIVTKLLIDNKLCIQPSTKRTFLIEGNLPLPIVPESMIFHFWLPPKPTTPPDLSSKSWNICLSLIMCREHPLSRYHDWCLCGSIKEIWNVDHLILMYPLSGFSFVRISRGSDPLISNPVMSPN